MLLFSAKLPEYIFIKPLGRLEQITCVASDTQRTTLCRLVLLFIQDNMEIPDQPKSCNWILFPVCEAVWQSSYSAPTNRISFHVFKGLEKVQFTTDCIDIVGSFLSS